MIGEIWEIGKVEPLHTILKERFLGGGRFRTQFLKKKIFFHFLKKSEKSSKTSFFSDFLDP